MGQRFEMPIFQGFDGNGDPLSGGLLYSYIAESNTPKSLYYDKELTTPASNPVILNSYGYAQNGSNVTTGLYGTGTYKLVLNNSAGVQQWSLDNVSGGGGGGDGGAYVSDYGCDIAAAITALGATETTLTIDCDIVLTATADTPVTLNIRWIRGSVVTLGAFNLNIGNMTDPGPFKIFDENSTGVVTFDGYAIDCIRPEWWGAAADGATECGVALQNAVTCSGSSNNITVELLTGTYLISTGLSTYKPLKMRGQGSRRTIITTSSAIRMLDIGKDQATVVSGVNLSAFGMDGNEVAESGIWVDQGSWINLNDLEVREIAGRGLTIVGQWDGSVSNCRFPQNGVFATLTPSVYIGNSSKGRQCNSIKWVGHNNIERADYSHLILEDTTAISFIGQKIHGRPPALDRADLYPLVQILGSTRITFDALQMVNSRHRGIYIGESDAGKSSDVVIVNSTFNGIGNYNVEPLTISGITNANPAEVTTVEDHGLTTGDAVYIYGVVGAAHVLPQVSLGDLVNHDPDAIPFVITEGSTSKKFTLDGADSSIADYSAYASRGWVVPADDTHDAWWIYIDDGAAVLSNNDFYYTRVLLGCTFTDVGDLVGTVNPHDFETDDAILFTEINTTTGISINTTYFVIYVDDNYFQLSATPGGAALPLGGGNGTGKYLNDDSISYTCLGGDIYNNPTNTKNLVYGQNKFYTQAGHTILDTGGGDYHYLKGNFVYKHNSVNSVPWIIRVEDGLTDGSSETHDAFSVQADGTLRWHTTAGAIDVLMEKLLASKTLSVTGPSDEVDTKLSLDRLHLRALSAEPNPKSTGDIVRADNATWDPLTIAGSTDYLVWWNGSAWRRLDTDPPP